MDGHPAKLGQAATDGIGQLTLITPQMAREAMAPLRKSACARVVCVLTWERVSDFGTHTSVPVPSGRSCVCRISASGISTYSSRAGLRYSRHTPGVGLFPRYPRRTVAS